MKRRIIGALTAWALLAATAQPAHAHGSYHELLAVVNKELAESPSDHALVRRRAALHVEHEDWKSAMVDLERAERLGAAPGGLDLLRGRALLLGDFPEQAEAALAAHLASHAPDPSACAVHARSLILLGRSAAGLERYQQALSLTTEPTEDLVLEAASAFANHGALNEAILLLRQGVSRPDCSPALLSQSLEYELAAQNFNAALSCVDALQKTSPRPEPMMAHRARILAQAGRSTESRTSWATLRAHLEALPSLERGTPLLSGLLTEARHALGAAAPLQVLAPPAPLSSPKPQASSSLPKNP